MDRGVLNIFIHPSVRDKIGHAVHETVEGMLEAVLKTHGHKAAHEIACGYASYRKKRS